MRVAAIATLALTPTNLPLDLDCQTKSDPVCRLQPSVRLRTGAPLRRFPVGSWLPWSESFPVRVELNWVEFTAKRPPRVLLAYALQGHFGPHQVDVARASARSTDAEREAIAGPWRALLAQSSVASAAEQHSALNRKQVKPWHMLAAMFGLPGLILAMGLCSTVKSLPEAALGVVVMLVPGALSFWFFSRLFSRRTLALLALAVAAVPFASLARSGASASTAPGACEFVFPESGRSGLVLAGDAACLDNQQPADCNDSALTLLAKIPVQRSRLTPNASCDSLEYESCPTGPAHRRKCGPARTEAEP